MDNFMVRHAGTMFMVVILAGAFMGCRTVYVNSVHNQRTGGAVETTLKDNTGTSEAQMGKTVTTETQLPIDKIAEAVTGEGLVDEAVEAVADAVEENEDAE